MSVKELDVTIFIPCYNESKNIVAAIETVNKSFEILKLSYEIIVMDDGSKDNSYEVVKDYIHNNPQHNVRIYRQPRNMGLAHNFADAAVLGQGRYFRQVNGDADESVENMLKLFKHLGQVDIIIPYHEDVTARTIIRRVVSKMYTFLVNCITSLDLKYYNGMPIYRRNDVLRWHSYSQGYGYQAEFLTCLLFKGRTYIETPLIAVPRKHGKSKAFSLNNFLSIAHTCLTLIMFRLSAQHRVSVCVLEQ